MFDFFKKRKMAARSKSAKNSLTVGVSVTACKDCAKYNKGVDIMEIFSWKSIFLGFDRETKEILIAEEQLMRIIQMVNPVQLPRKIRLVSQEELRGRRHP